MQYSDVIATLLCLILTSFGISQFIKTNPQITHSNKANATTLDKFVVLTSSVPYKESQFTYPYYLPVTAKIWQQFGYKTIIFLTGDTSKWSTNPILNFITKTLTSSKNIELHYLNSENKTSILLSQISRIFVSNLAPNSSRYYLTSDVDLWPTNNSYLTTTKPILATSPLGKGHGCCYRYLATSCIGMSSDTWLEVMNFQDVDKTQNLINLAPREEDYKNTSWIQYPWNHGDKINLVKNSKQILSYLKAEFGDFVEKGSRKTSKFIKQNNSKNDYLDSTKNWFLDQRLVSKRIGQWVRRNGNGLVEYGEKPDERNRLSRGKIWNFEEIKKNEKSSKVNTLHLPHATYFTGSWNKLREVIKRLVKNYEDLKYCDDYRAKFIELFRKEFGPETKRKLRSVENDDNNFENDEGQDFERLFSKGFIKLHVH